LDRRVGVKEGLRMHAEGVNDGGAELATPGVVYYLSDARKSGGYAQVNGVGKRGKDVKAEGVWGVRRIVGKEGALVDGEYTSYKGALGKGEVGIME